VKLDEEVFHEEQQQHQHMTKMTKKKKSRKEINKAHCATFEKNNPKHNSRSRYLKKSKHKRK